MQSSILCYLLLTALLILSSSVWFNDIVSKNLNKKGKNCRFGILVVSRIRRSCKVLYFNNIHISIKPCLWYIINKILSIWSASSRNSGSCPQRKFLNEINIQGKLLISYSSPLAAVLLKKYWSYTHAHAHILQWKKWFLIIPSTQMYLFSCFYFYCHVWLRSPLLHWGSFQYEQPCKSQYNKITYFLSYPFKSTNIYAVFPCSCWIKSYARVDMQRLSRSPSYVLCYILERTYCQISLCFLVWLSCY